MEHLSGFVIQLENAIPCKSHQRKNNKFSLTKYDTSNPQRMGLLAVVTELKDKFKISAKEWLANDQCMKLGKRGRWGHGKEPDGTVLLSLDFYVKKGSTGQDYQNAICCLKVISRNLS